MDFSSQELFKIIITIASITYSVIFGILAKKVWDVPNTVQRHLDEYSNKLETRFLRLDEESKTAHRRLNVQDRITSKLAGRDFDSRAIAASGVYPDIKTRVSDE